MNKLLALFRREYLEHRGAFFWAPIALLGVLTAGIALALVGNRVRLPAELGLPGPLKLYELGFLAMTQAWWWYLLVTLFFYFADAFSADRRNNAMLFWKSMPVSDLGMLASKLGAGVVFFTAIIFGFVLLTGVVLYLLTVLASFTLPGVQLPRLESVGASYAGIVWYAVCHFALGILWFTPFLAWVGLLSTIFRRWSMPLAALIPLVLALLENAALYGNVPSGGYIYNYLKWRLQFGLSNEIWAMSALAGPTVNTRPMVALLLDGMDWRQLGGGLVVAAVLVYVASLFRRRGVTS